MKIPVYIPVAAAAAAAADTRRGLSKKTPLLTSLRRLEALEIAKVPQVLYSSVPQNQKVRQQRPQSARIPPK